MAEHGLDFIRQNKSRPFFAYFPFTLPHGSWHVPEDSMAEYRGKFPGPEKPQPGNKRLAPQPEPRVAFAGMVSRLDRYVGQVLALLKELSLEKDTIVFFCSDNGGVNVSSTFFNSCGPFRGNKGNVYEGGIRVPMVVRWPGRVPVGKVSSFAWMFEDILPTFAELAGVKSTPRCDGMSVLPTLLGKSQKAHAELYWELPRYEAEGVWPMVTSRNPLDEIPMQAMRRGNWKAVRPKPNGPIELYDLKADIGEQHDLAGENPALVAEFDRAMKAARFPPRPAKEPAHPWWDVRS
jgi:arylsulfatase A-like enzyme